MPRNPKRDQIDGHHIKELLAAKDEAASTASKPTQFSFLITTAQKHALKRLGYGDDAIRSLTPEEAHEILGLKGR
jgi:hypothetical protein